MSSQEIQDREEEQLNNLQESIDEIRQLLKEIKTRQANTRHLVNEFKDQDYDLEAVYQRAREWRHQRGSWSREYTPTPPPPSTLHLAASEKSFLEEMEEAEAMETVVEEVLEEVEEVEEEEQAEEAAEEDAAAEEEEEAAEEEEETADAAETTEAAVETAEEAAS